MTYEELKKETYNFEPSDFWSWFLLTSELDYDQKVSILTWVIPSGNHDTIEVVVNYMKREELIT